MITKIAHNYLSQGNYQYLAGNLNEAITFYNKAIKTSPDYAEAYYKLGFIYFRRGKLTNAEECLNKCNQLVRNNEKALLLHGKVLHSLGKMDKSIRAFRLALKINNNSMEAISGIASVYEYKKDFDRAYKTIQPLVSESIQNDQIAIIFARFCSKLNLCDVAIDYINSCIASNKINDKEILSFLYYAKGDIYDRSKNYHEAFIAYKTANDLRRLPYNEFNYRNFIDNIKSTYTHTFLTGRPVSTLYTDRPIFIIGMPRSGTSLVEQILSSHSNVYGAGELTDIGNIAGKIGGRIGVPAEYSKAFRRINSETLTTFAEQYLNRLKGLDNKAKHVTDKMPHNYLYLGLISQLFPNCKIIHCIRNPLDTCLSIYFKSFNDSHEYATDLLDLAHHYYHYKDIMDYWKGVLPLKIYDIKYEDVISNFKGEVAGLLDFCGLEWEQNCMDFYKTQRHVGTASENQVSQPLYSSSVNRWKNYEIEIQPLIDEMIARKLSL